MIVQLIYSVNMHEYNSYTARRQAGTILVLLATILILLLVRTYVLIELGTKNFEYAYLQDEIKQIKLQNNLLQQEILTKRSYQYIKQEASKSGFIPITNYKVLWSIK